MTQMSQPFAMNNVVLVREISQDFCLSTQVLYLHSGYIKACFLRRIVTVLRIPTFGNFYDDLCSVCVYTLAGHKQSSLFFFPIWSWFETRVTNTNWKLTRSRYKDLHWKSFSLVKFIILIFYGLFCFFKFVLYIYRQFSALVSIATRLRQWRSTSEPC